MLALYKRYCEELSQYDDQTYPDGHDERTYWDYEESNVSKITKIEKDGKVIGFLISYSNPPETKELFICEAYIVPEYRNHGYMREAVKEAIRGDYNMIRFMVFNDNPAIKFWEKMMQEAGYKRVARQEHSSCLCEYFYWKD